MTDHDRHIWLEINLFRRLPVFFVGQTTDVAIRMRLADFLCDGVDEFPDMIGKHAVGSGLRPQIRLALRTFANPRQSVVRHDGIDFHFGIGVEILANIVAPCFQQIRIVEAEMTMAVRHTLVCERAFAVDERPEFRMVLLMRLHPVEAVDDEHGGVAAESRAMKPQRVVFILFKQTEPRITIAEARRTRHVDFRKFQVINWLQNDSVLSRPIEADTAKLF